MHYTIFEQLEETGIKIKQLCVEEKTIWSSTQNVLWNVVLWLMNILFLL